MENYTGHRAIAGVYHKIINEIPAFDSFHELFAGSAAISSLLSVAAARLHVNEISPSVFLELCSKFPESTVTNECAISLLKKWRPKKKQVIFLDPPYHHSTRPKNTNLYEFEMPDDDHVKMLSAVVAMDKVKIMIIHPKCELYDQMLADWRKVEIKIRYNRKTSFECLYMNFPATQDLHNYQYLGSDCWDRQRIKRKGDRLLAKLRKLPVLERNYIINRINEINQTQNEKTI